MELVRTNAALAMPAANRMTNFMKTMTWKISLLLGLMAGSFAHESARAQPLTVVPRLKGIGKCDIPGYGIDVQVVENLAFMAWSSGYQPSGTNDLGGFEDFEVSNPTKPVRVGGYRSRAAVNAIRVAGHYVYLATRMAFTAARLR